MNFDRRITEAVARHPYPLIFATISGAHLYGFPSADSDFDIRGVHILPVAEVVGLKEPPETLESSVVEDGLEIDLVTHDVKKFFGLMLKRNGYVLEQLLSPLILSTSSDHEELKRLAPQCITRHHFHHYRGFAANQWKLFNGDDPQRVKPLLYVYRVLLTGVHLMRTGEVEANLVNLLLDQPLAHVSELIAQKSTGGERQELAPAETEFHQGEYERLFGELERAYEKSTLPELPTAGPALSDLVIQIRLRYV